MEEKRKHKWVVMLCCFIASVCLWLYISNVQNIIRTYSITVPVSIINEESVSQYKLAVLKDQQYNVTLTIKGALPYIDAVKPNDFKVVADLGDYAVKKGQNKIPLEIKEIPQNVNIINKDTLWVIINIDDLEEKNVPIKVNVNGNAKEGYSAFDPVLTPTEAVITGAAKYVDTVKSVNANIDIKNSDKDISTSLPLQVLNDGGNVVSDIKIQPSVVSVLVPVRKAKTVSVNVHTQNNLNKNLKLKSITTSPENIEIAGGNEIANITKLDTEAIDLSSISDSTTLKVKLIVPEGAKLINSNGVVQVKVTVENNLQKNFNVDIQPKNLTDNYNATLSTNKLSLIVSGTQSIISNLKNSDITSSVDLTSLGEGSYNVAVIVNVPDGVKIESQSVDNVKVTIKKKDSAVTVAPTPTTSAPTVTPTPTLAPTQ